MNTSFFSELLQAISDRGRALLDRGAIRRIGGAAPPQDLVELCEKLLSGRGEASGVALAREILARYSGLDGEARISFFDALATRFGSEAKRMARALEAWQKAPSDETARAVHVASEPRRQELFRRMNLAPAGTAALVGLRAQLRETLSRRGDLSVVDDDLVHLFSSWFNRGFLVLRRIDWSTPAAVLEKIIRYEAVHAITGWEDLRRRIDPPDRRCYAFFHPALVDEPLIFVEVALTRGIPPAITPILAEGREMLEPEHATTATFYSISNCQHGLAGITFGHFLIKQVAEEISRELPRLATFVTLSPVPGFATWLASELANERASNLDPDDHAALRLIDTATLSTDAAGAERGREPLLRAAASYLLSARNRAGLPLDPVARFHLGNGARLDRINWLADTSTKGLRQSHGIMVNYLYDLDDIEKNHERYAEHHSVIASAAVTRLVDGAPRRASASR